MDEGFGKEVGWPEINLYRVSAGRCEGRAGKHEEGRESTRRCMRRVRIGG